MTSRWLAGMSLLAIAGPLHGQVVRGVVRDARTQAPIPGVIVALDEAGETRITTDSLQRASLILAVLTNERGEYSVQAIKVGRWVISAKMVGLRRYISPPFDMGVGENVRRDITLEPIDFTASLPTVSVTTDAPCSINPRESQRVAAMWEEARTALTAAQLSLRDRLFRATVVRYQRQLSPNGLRVLRQDQNVRRGVTERPFVSVAAERLSREGYVQTDAGGDLTFNAPDADVLTSTAFVRDHCFSVSRPSR
ncbi:MAG: carboxypeptidase regulatory-like domain-containing protein, partial [Cytophagaceae bacterium]|nr:carboxypeptidase regulatory-like domain-containing protein [Gemmatimonadaceae bacterium]